VSFISPDLASLERILTAKLTAALKKLAAGTVRKYFSGQENFSNGRIAIV
jgi:hypothetical protein